MSKKLWIIIAAALVTAAVLAAAGIAVATLPCSHRWQRATCTEAEICISCGQTRGTGLGHFFMDADCAHPETCGICGITRGEPREHTWLAAGCDIGEVCGECGTTRGEPLGHIWQNATCTAPEICARCGELQEPVTDHNWTPAGCDTAESCAFCGLTQGEPLGHTWADATCSTPKTCTRCALTEGDILPHSWQGATCQAPVTCSLCGLTQGEKTDHLWRGATCSNPETCAYCGLTRSSALGHIWQSATCTSPIRCSRCGTTSGSPLGHTLGETAADGTKLCSTCGQPVTLKYAAITFDDGPSGSITDTLLAGLKEREVKATFFICGYRIRSFLSQPQKILDGGHEIGLHTDNHATLTRLDAAGIRRELEGMMHLLPAGYPIKLMRPPGGAHNATVRQVCGDLGLSVIMWSVDPRDWASNDSAAIARKIVSGAYDGSIILMHDLKSSSVRAALLAIDELRAQGYVFVTVSELAAIKGYQLTPGVVYNALK